MPDFSFFRRFKKNVNKKKIKEELSINEFLF